MKRFLSSLVICILALLQNACMPYVAKPGPVVADAYITDQAYVTADGKILKLSSWLTPRPKAIVVALHGFNDYRRFFTSTAEYLQTQEISSYAYDQRGFGESANPGLWAGNDAYAHDLSRFVGLIQQRHPAVPVYLLGESMGGAMVIDTLTRSQKPDVAGVILAAPAVWGRDTMPWYQTSLLWVLSHSLPWLTLTGEGMGILPSDNIEMLRALGRDPLVIKETRVDAMHGLTDLMDAALQAAPNLQVPTLLLYGKKDQVVPAEPTALFVEGLLQKEAELKKVTYYDNGYHMLLRDLQAPIVWKDVSDWIQHGAQSQFAHGLAEKSLTN